MKIYAHRGYSGMYPENTMLAFREAEKTGCDGIELDVQLTKDGIVVVVHDESLDRVSDKTGFVRDYTYEELKEVNVAYTWGGKYGFQPIPTFEEYCRWVKNTNLTTNIELKTGVFYYEEIEEKTLNLVRKYGLEKRVLFSSFNHLSLVKMQSLEPQIPVAALLEHRGLGNAGFYCHEYGFQFYHPGIKGLNQKTVDNCKKQGIAVNVWTINAMDELEHIYEWGCDGAITNYPSIVKAWLDSKNK
ncbi:MAG: glycerophosphodiester phosphodiesterase [Eubacteriales bacterium]|nr:glycerophosphodiester phosphodiesterase [Eubacteriales bacterium]